MAKTSTTTRTWTAQDAAFFAASGALSMVVTDDQGDLAVVTRDGHVIPADDMDQARYISALADRRVMESDQAFLDTFDPE